MEFSTTSSRVVSSKKKKRKKNYSSFPKRKKERKERRMAESKCHSLRQPDIRQFFGFRIGVHSLKSSMHARKYCCGGKARKERVDFFFSPSCGRKEVDLKGCTTTTSPSGNNRARTKSRPFIYGWSTGQQQQKGYGGSIPFWPPL